ncbi:MAG: DUF711 family protein [Ktedonobacterales bacterium]|nr:DUF711 family protein [Ktedonobacterales bacterium]
MSATIRTITVGIGDPHPVDERAIERAAVFLREARARAEAAGHIVQTTRIALRPLLADMLTADDTAIMRYAHRLQQDCDARNITYCSLGPAPAELPGFPMERITLFPHLLAQHASLSATVQLASARHGPRYEAALAVARAMRDVAERGGGETNFRFAALAVCDPGGPFFPQAYATGGPWQVAVGLQSAGIVRQAIAALAADPDALPLSLSAVSAAVAVALAEAARPVVELVSALARAGGLGFSGVDLSPAPMGEESIADAIEATGLGRFGAPGTLAVAEAITAGIQGTTLPTCGYCGLMLPVLEDRTIGLRCAEGGISAQALLAYSAVCGTGLDTVPIPGETPPERVAALLMDVAALAHRLRKPLSARLFLVPGAQAGEMTTFRSPHLTNTRVLPIR